MSIKNGLVEEFNNRLKEIGKMDVKTDEYKIAVDELTKIADRIIEIEKFETENEIKNSQLTDENRDRLIRNAILIGTTVGGWAMAWLIHMSSMKYDEKGVIPSLPGGRSVINQLLKFKS